MNKKNYLFDKDQHLWIEEEDGEYYFGITDFAITVEGIIIEFSLTITVIMVLLFAVIFKE